MKCRKDCKDYKEFVNQLEKSIAKSNCGYVPKSFERQNRNLL